jgi:hypothetical protein
MKRSNGPTGAQPDLGAFEGGDGRPRQQVCEPPTRANGQPIHHGMLVAEPGGEIAQPADDRAVGGPHQPTSSRLSTSTSAA